MSGLTGGVERLAVRRGCSVTTPSSGLNWT